LWANDAELAMLGYSPGEFIGHEIREFHADAEVINDMLKRVSKGETLRNYSARLRAKECSIRHVLINANAFQEDGKCVYIQCFTRDVTEHKAAEQDQAVLSAVIDSAEDAIVSKTLDGVITSWNPGAQRIFGYSAEEVIGKSITILIPPEQH